MFGWIKYLVRVLASVGLVLLALIFGIMGAFEPKARAIGLGGAAVFAIAGLLSWPRRPNAWRSDPPTDRQLRYAADLGIQVPRRATKGQVSDLISEATGR